VGIGNTRARMSRLLDEHLSTLGLPNLNHCLHRYVIPLSQTICCYNNLAPRI
jgi:hypothetical protein